MNPTPDIWNPVQNYSQLKFDLRKVKTRSIRRVNEKERLTDIKLSVIKIFITKNILSSSLEIP